MTDWAALPLGMFAPAGTGASQISPLLWGLMWLSVIVVFVIAVAVVAGVSRGASRERNPVDVPVTRDGNGLMWIFVGVGVSTVVLMGFIGWTMVTMAQMISPPNQPSLTINVAARQWWWEVAYEANRAGSVFRTANEIHIPVGEPVAFKLTSPDVIHSFWVPALGGKTDVIPGRVNTTWLLAEKPGIYRGQCAEYCGLQHSWMGFYVVAQTPGEFRAWRARQEEPALAPNADELQTGLNQFVARCGKCHSVSGTRARGNKGPDLTHVMSRTSLAAALLHNSPGNLAGWIAHPQGLKPGALMPDIDMSGPEFQAILKYVQTLK